jgi:Protein of unknown function (DUF3011)
MGNPTSRRTFRQAVAATVCVGLAIGPLPVRAEQTISCESRGFGYRYCRVDTDDRVELIRTYSIVSCRQDRTWGYDRHGVWVDRGCAAEFRVGRRHGNDRAAVGVALVGLAALAAIAAAKNKQDSEEVASWAVGNFSGYDEYERADVQLTILPGGSVSGRAAGNDFSGSLKGSRLEAGRHQFRIERSGNGFTATDEREPSHRVVFQRSGSGY